jgi:hypothetical protein
MKSPIPRQLLARYNPKPREHRDLPQNNGTRRISTLKISECWKLAEVGFSGSPFGFDGDSHAVSQLTKAQFDQDSMRHLQGRFQSWYFKMVVFPREHIESFVRTQVRG